MRPWIATLTLLLAAAALAPEARAQRLTLDEAFRRADHDAYANRGAAAAASARAGQAISALRGVLPTLRLETGYTRTTDPLTAFGLRLEQRAVTAQDFDPTRLNDPAAIGNYGAAVVVEQPLINVDAFAGRAAATRARDAAQASARWTRETSRLDVVRAYYGAVLTAERVTTLDTAARAAHAHVAQAESMLRNGVVTRSDVLLASVRAGDVDAQLAGARADAALARQRLALVLGTPADTAFTLPERLPADARITGLADTAQQAAPDSTRADVEAASLALDAARANRERARAAFLPRLNSFARLSWNSPARPVGGTHAWTAGLMLSWTPFAGGGQIGDARTAAADEAQARANAEAASAQAALDLAQSSSALRVALVRLDIASRAVDQAAEAHRIVDRTYVGGLATITELLDAQAAETQSRLALSDARYQTILAIAARRQALGLALTALDALDR